MHRQIGYTGYAALCLLLLLLHPSDLDAREAIRVGRLQGRVEDAAGRPVAGVRVRAWDAHIHQHVPTRSEALLLEQGGLHRLMGEAQTDARGQWTITGLEARRQFLVHAAQGEGRPGVSGWGTALVVAGPPLRLRARTGQAVHGQLVGADGKGVQGFVSATAQASTTIWGQRGFGPTQQLLYGEATDAHGYFEVVIPTGTQAHLEGYAAGLGARHGIRVDVAKAAARAAKPIRVSLRESKGAIVEGVVRSSDGSTVADALVVVHVMSRRVHTQGISCRAIARTDADGRYRLSNLPLGNFHSLAVLAEGYLIALERSTSPLPALPLLAEHPLRIDPVLQRGRSVRGVVVDERGAPIAGALVREGWRPGFGFSMPDGARTDTEGRFELRDVPTGELRLLAAAPGLHPVYPKTRHRRAGLVVPPGAASSETDVRVVLSRGVALRGRVVSTAGEPLIGAALRVMASPGRAMADASSNIVVIGSSGTGGHFHLAGIPRDAHLSVVVDASGFVLHEARLVASDEGLGTPLAIALEPSCRVAGRLMDKAGKPVAGMSVYAADMNRPTETDAQGRFALDRVPPGRQVIAVGPLGPPIVSQLVDLKPGEERRDLAFRLPGDKVLAGIVTTKDRTPLAGVSVHIHRIDNPQGATIVRTGADGRFRLHHVPDGRYTVSAGVPARRPRIVPAGAADLSLEISGEARRVVRGTVRDRTGEPVARGVVEAFVPGDQGNVVRATAPIFEGRFRIAVQAADSKIELRFRDAMDAQGERLDLRPTTVAKGVLGGEALAVVLPPAHVLSGRVVDPDGAPVPGLRLTCSHADRSHRFGGTNIPAETDADGRFVFRGLKSGTVRITVDDTTGWAPPPTLTVPSTSTDLRITVARYGKLSGQVVDDKGEPVAGTRVILQHPANRNVEGVHEAYARPQPFTRYATTMRDGRFHISAIPPGIRPDLTLILPEALRAHFLPFVRKAMDPGGGAQVLKLERGLELAGRVTDPQGGPVAGIQVTTREADVAKGKQPDPALGLQAYTDEDGRYRMGAFRKGVVVDIHFTLTAAHRKQNAPWLPHRQAGHVVGSGPADVQLREGVKISGIVVQANAAELRGFSFRLHSKTHPRAGHFRFDGKSAEFHFANLEPGEYMLTVSSRPRRSKFLIYQTRTVTAPCERLEIIPIRRYQLHGRVVGRDMSGYRVAWMPTRGKGASVYVQSDGTFNLGTHSNTPGQLLVRKPGNPWIALLKHTPSAKGVEVTLKLGAVIRGRIQDLEAKVRRGTLRATQGKLSYEGTIAEDGWFEVAGLPPGAYTLAFDLRVRGEIRFQLPEPVPAGTTELLVPLP